MAVWKPRHFTATCFSLQKRGGTVLWRFLAGPGAERNGMQRLPRDAEGNGDGEPGGRHQQAHVSEGVEQGVEEQPPLPPIQEQRSVRRHDGNEGTPDDAEVRLLPANFPSTAHP